MFTQITAVAAATAIAAVTLTGLAAPAGATTSMHEKQAAYHAWEYERMGTVYDTNAGRTIIHTYKPMRDRTKKQGYGGSTRFDPVTGAFRSSSVQHDQNGKPIRGARKWFQCANIYTSDCWARSEQPGHKTWRKIDPRKPVKMSIGAFLRPNSDPSFEFTPLTDYSFEGDRGTVTMFNGAHYSIEFRRDSFTTTHELPAVDSFGNTSSTWSHETVSFSDSRMTVRPPKRFAPGYAETRVVYL